MPGEEWLDEKKKKRTDEAVGLARETRHRHGKPRRRAHANGRSVGSILRVGLGVLRGVHAGFRSDERSVVSYPGVVRQLQREGASPMVSD